MFKKYLVGGLSLVSLSICACLLIIAQRAQGESVPSQSPVWHREKWDGNELPYATIRSKVYREFPDDGSPQLLLQRYKKYKAQAQKRPQDPMAQFALGYACYRAIRLRLPITNTWQIAEAIGRVPSPHTYQFARMRYIIEKVSPFYSRYPAFAATMKKVGARLLQRNPDDYDVKFFHIKSLDVRDPKEKQLALQYANDLIRMAPRKASAYATLGNVYNEIWSWSNLQPNPGGKTKHKWVGTLDQVNRDKAIAAYRKALQFLSTQDREYQIIQRTINHMMQGLPI